MSVRSRRWILVLSGLLALVALGYAWLLHEARAPDVSRNGDSVRLQGPLVDASVDAVLELIESAPQPIQRLVLRSQGGDLRAAMRLGTAVLERGLDVEVDGYCVSACAAYVFTAGQHKRILSGSLVAWYGSANQADMQDGRWETSWRHSQHCETDTPDCTARLAKLRDYLEQARQEHLAFFSRIKVDEQLTVYGQDVAPCNCSWTFGLADMARMGLEQVSADPNYPAQPGYWARQVQAEHEVKLLKLPAAEYAAP